MLVRTLCVFASCAFAAVPNIFESGKPAFAKQVNENFKYSETRIDSIVESIKNDSTKTQFKAEIQNLITASDSKYVNYGYNQKVAASLRAKALSVESGSADDPALVIDPTNLKITSTPNTGLFMGVDDWGQYSIGPWKFGQGVGCTPYITFGSESLELPAPAVFKSDLIAQQPNMVISGTTFQSSQSIQRLDSLESYIKANKNLPGMPDKLDVASDGVNLITLNKILVKKIEELTLYMIEQDKRIKALEAKP